MKLTIILGLSLLASLAHASIPTFIECGNDFNKAEDKYLDFSLAAYSASGKFKGPNSGTAGTGWQFATQEGKWLDSHMVDVKFTKRTDSYTFTVIGGGGRYTFYTVSDVSQKKPHLEVKQLSGRISFVGSAECRVLK